MFKFAQEKEYDEELVLDWISGYIELNTKIKLRLYGIYRSEITKYQVSKILSEEYQRKFLGIIEYTKEL